MNSILKTQDQGINLDMFCPDNRLKISKIEKNIGVHKCIFHLCAKCKQKMISEGIPLEQEIAIHEKTTKIQSNQNSAKG